MALISAPNVKVTFSGTNLLLLTNVPNVIILVPNAQEQLILVLNVLQQENFSMPIQILVTHVRTIVMFVTW